MKTLALLLILAAAHGRPAPAWKSVAIPGVQQAWVCDRRPGHMLTVIDDVAPNPLGFYGSTPQDIASGLSAFRRLTLEHLGFSEWKLEKFAYSKNGGEETVEMSGSYRRPDSVAVRFFEVQKYSGRKFRQASYMMEAQAKHKEPKDVERLLTRAMNGEGPQ